MNSVYIACPSNCFTGGPTLLHQLCNSLVQRGVDAKMAYYAGAGTEPGGPMHPRYEKYACDYVMLEQVPDDSLDWLIVPETAVAKLKGFSRIHKAIWWLSVDNYVFGNLDLFEKVQKQLKRDPDVARFIKKQKFLNRPEFSDRSIAHLTQSEYARLFLESMDVDAKAIYPLSDYIDDSYLTLDLALSPVRSDVILYNPKKMGRLVRELRACEGFAEKLVPLQGMNQDQLIDAMKTAKVYVDFGSHPGKDRLPREAAFCGCCIVTGERGSAANDEDVSIPDEYKLEDDASIEVLQTLLISIFEDFDSRSSDFRAYREKIAREKGRFEEDVDMLQRVFSIG